MCVQMKAVRSVQTSRAAQRSCWTRRPGGVSSTLGQYSVFYIFINAFYILIAEVITNYMFCKYKLDK